MAALGNKPIWTNVSLAGSIRELDILEYLKNTNNTNVLNSLMPPAKQALLQTHSLIAGITYFLPYSYDPSSNEYVLSENLHHHLINVLPLHSLGQGLGKDQLQL